MSMTRMLTASIATGRRRWLAAAAAALGLLAVAPATADGFAVAVDWPDPVTVGQSGLTAHVTLTNDAATPATVCGLGECGGSAGILVVPSCGAASPPGTCTTPDLGVFTVAPSAPVAIGACGALPTSFSRRRGRPGPGLAAARSDRGPVVLGAQGTPTAVCDIPLTFAVAKLPATDTSQQKADAQTLQSASAQAQLDSPAGPVVQSGAGRDETTVLPGTVPQPPPPPIVIPPPPPIGIPQPPPPPPVIQPSNLDHFKCYEALQPNFRQRTVGTRDQFGQRRARVLRTRQLCNPVSKNGGKVQQPRAHLVCYETRDTGNATPPRTVIVTNQFGQRKLTTRRPNRLCVPSLKRKTPGSVPSTPNPERVLDHFRCYDVVQQPASQTVKLSDQFGATAAKVVRVIRLCNPVRKNNTPVRRAKSHLVCYSITDSPAFKPLAVQVRNQFGRAALRIRRPETLCLPSFKEVVATPAPATAPAGLDHFKCYDAEQPQLPVRFVGLRDQFGQSEGQVIATRQLCNPVSKNNGRVLNRSAHLVCYQTPSGGDGALPAAGGARVQPVRRAPALGDQAGRAVRPVAEAQGGGRGSDRLEPGARARPLPLLRRQAAGGGQGREARRPVQDLEHEGGAGRAAVQPGAQEPTPVKRAQAHLVCYSIVEGAFQPLAVTVRNQFGVAGLRVRKPSMLCLPSFKKLVNAAGVEIAVPPSG